ncbi:MAG: AsmA-like C-terminal region-containing protein [Flavobacteriales bacterium]|nr:AsmA-like C-terminal region-containing protein [Flavobacteriales bacterium]
MSHKALKIALISTVSFVGLILIAMAAIPYFFKDKIIDAALTAANENLNAKVIVEPSDIDFSLFSSFPNFTLSAKDFAIEGNGVFEGKRLIDTKEIYAVIDIMSVFSGTPKIKRVGLDTPIINVLVSKDGKANYDIIKPSSDTTTTADTSASSFNIDLKKYKISHATINYIDSTSKMGLHIGELNHTGSGAMRSERFSLSTSTTIDTLTFDMDGTKYVKDAHILGNITMDMDMEQMVFAIDTQGEKYNLKLNDIDLLCEGKIAMPKTGGMDIDLHLGSGKTSFASLLSLIPPTYAKMLDGVETQGTFEMDGTVKGFYDEKNMPAIDMKLLAENGQIKYPSLPKSIDKINIAVNVKSPQSKDLDAMVVDMPTCTMEIAGSPLTATAHLATPISDPDVKASLKTKLNIASLRDVMPLEKDDKVQGTIDANVSIAGRMSSLDAGRYEQFKADGSINVSDMIYATKSITSSVEIPSAQLIFSPKALELRTFDVKIGESDLSLRGALSNYLGYYLKDQEMKGNLKVSSNNMNLSALMPQTDSTATTTAKTEKKTAEATSSEPISLPKNINFDTELNLKKVTYENISLTNVVGNLGLKDQTAYLKGVGVDVAKGKATISGSYNAQEPENAKLDMKFGLTSLDIPTVANMFESVKKIAPIAGTVTGTIGGTVTLNTALDKNMEPAYKTMNSRGALKTQKLKLTESGLMKTVGTALGIKALQNDPQVSDLDLNYTITDGKLTLAPTSMNVAGISTKISGDMTMGTFEMNMLSDMVIPRTMLSSDINNTINTAVKALSSIGVKTNVDENLAIAGVITGPASSPKYSIAYGPDHNASLGEYVKSEVSKAGTKAANAAKEKATETVKEKASSVLKNLFGKKN